MWSLCGRADKNDDVRFAWEPDVGTRAKQDGSPADVAFETTPTGELSDLEEPGEHVIGVSARRRLRYRSITP